MTIKKSSTLHSGANPNPVDKGGLCLLSLDGGGVRGLSSLHMLKRIMDEINRLRKEKGLRSRLPCEVFDMIGGTSTGGLIAIMLGRLNMNVDDCIKEYENLMGSIFGSKLHWSPISVSTYVNAQYDSKRVKAAIQEVLRKRGIPEESLLNDEKERDCKVYKHKFKDNIPATIWQAALATSAATTYFEPLAIGPCHYVDGGLRNNNPVVEVETEAQHLWCPDQVELKPLVKCFLSVGTGTPAKGAISDNAIKVVFKDLKYLATDTEAIHQSFQDRWRWQLNEKRFFRFDVSQGLQNVDLADYQKQGTIMEATGEYMNEGDQQIKLQACTKNLMDKELKSTPLDFHETVSIYNRRVVQGSYDIKEIRECRDVLRVTNVEKDREDLRNNKGARVPGTFEWITTDAKYQDWQTLGPDALWITAGPARGKTMLSFFILEDLEKHISLLVNPPGSDVQEEHRKNADLYYFFCSSEEGSRRGAVAVFRSLIHQIVSKHEDLMKYVLEYLDNNRPHADKQTDDENEKKSGSQEKKEERSRSVNIQDAAERKFPTQAKFVKNLLRAPTGNEVSKEAQPDKVLEDRPKSKSNIFRNVLGKSRKEERPKTEEQQDTETESDTADSTDPSERDSPKSRQLELLDVSELSFMLTTLIRELPVDTAYFLLDGVDECNKEEQEALTSTMLKLKDVEPGKFKLLAVSRLISGMGTTPTIKLEETEQTTSDIEKFVSKSIERFANIDGFSSIQQDVKENLLRGAEGTFLWISLVMREIEKLKTSTDILTASKSVPQGLNNKYSHMLQQIDQAHGQKIYKMIRWVTAAVRPLTLQELSEVIEAPASTSEQVVRDRVTSTEGLLEVRGDEVALIHASARDFLLFDGRVSKLSDSEDPKLLKYAIKYWMEHVKASDWADKNFDPKAEFFQRDSKLRKNWWTAYLEDSQNDDPKNFNVSSFSHLAAYFGIVAWIKPALEGKAWLTKKGTIFMELDHYYRTPLHIAVEQGHDSVVSLLLTHGVDREFREASLFATPLHLAARNGHKKICKILLDHQAKVNARNRFYSTPLTEAARGGHLEVVKLLVQRGADINGSIDKNHRLLYRHLENVPGYTKRALGNIKGLAYAERSTPVIEAARQNHAEIIMYLFQYRAKIEAKTLAGFNALHIAAYHGQMKSMTALIELGANIERKNESSQTALFMAAWQNHADVVKYLLDKDANIDNATDWGFTPLLVASRNGYVEPMKVLLEAQAKVEHRDETGFTSVAVAAKFGKVAAVKLLIDSNANINAEDQSGNTALMHAIQENLADVHVEMVQLLLKHGASVNHKNTKGLTPLMKAAKVSNGDAVNILQHLLEAGAALEATDNEGKTALMHASKLDSSGNQDLLLDRGATLEAKDNLCDTALIIAAGYSDGNTVYSLLDRGPDIEARNQFGFTPLIKAARCGEPETVDLLLARGALIAVVDDEGKAAIDHASEYKRGDIIKLLKSSGASRHNLRVADHAASTLSNLNVYWSLEACRESERGWEIEKLKSMGKSSSTEDSDEKAATLEQDEQEIPVDTDKASDVDSDTTKVELIHDDNPQTSAEERVSADVQDPSNGESFTAVVIQAETDMGKGGVNSNAEKESDQETPNLIVGNNSQRQNND